MLELLGALGGIVLVDLALSGDNALVIGAAASDLPRRQRWLAIVLGGGGAIVLRIVFALVVTFLLQLPFLQAIGGVVLLYIAVRLLLDRTGSHGSATDERPQPQAPADEDATCKRDTRHRTLWSALVTILIADVTMSLDNVLAIGALAAGDLAVLVIGLLVSIGLVLVGSALVAELSRRVPWLLDVAALVLGWTAGNMLLHDLRLGPALERLPGAWLIIPAAGALVVLAVDIGVARSRAARPSAPLRGKGQSNSTTAA